MPVGRTNRRAFIAGFRGAVAWPLLVHAEERAKRLRIGFLMHLAPDDPDAMAGVAGLLQGL